MLILIQTHIHTHIHRTHKHTLTLKYTHTSPSFLPAGIVTSHLAFSKVHMLTWILAGERKGLRKGWDGGDIQE